MAKNLKFTGSHDKTAWQDPRSLGSHDIPNPDVRSKIQRIPHKTIYKSRIPSDPVTKLVDNIKNPQDRLDDYFRIGNGKTTTGDCIVSFFITPGARQRQIYSTDD